MIGKNKTHLNTTFDKDKVKELKKLSIDLSIGVNTLIEIMFKYFSELDKDKQLKLVTEYKAEKIKKKE